MKKTYYVYILTNETNKVLYVGVTNNLERRTFEHFLKVSKKGFAERYNCNKLVFLEEAPDIMSAIEREKQIKKFSRKKKIEMITEMNPTWRDFLGYGDK